MTLRLLFSSVLVSVLLVGCVGTFSALDSGVEDGATARPLDTLFVTIDMPQDDRSYARNLAVAFDSVFESRGIITQTSADANLALEDIPNLSLAREMASPYLLVVRELGVSGFSSAPTATHNVTLFSTHSETQLWSMRGEMSNGNAMADDVARLIFDKLKAHGFTPDPK